MSRTTITVGNIPVLVNTQPLTGVRIENKGFVPLWVVASVGESDPVDWTYKVVIKGGDSFIDDGSLTAWFPEIAGADTLYMISDRMTNVTVTQNSVFGGQVAQGHVGEPQTLPKPTATSSLADVSITMGDGNVTRDAGALFTGAAGGAWSVTVNGSVNDSVATIDSAGVVTVLDNTAITAATIVATYTNSGGSASRAFTATVNAATPTNTATAAITTSIPDAFVYDTQRGTQPASVPLEGTTDAADGTNIRARWVAYDDDTDALTGAVGPWQVMGAASSGAWAGTLTAPIGVRVYYRAECDVENSNGAAFEMTNRFAAGIVFAEWNQSNLNRILQGAYASALSSETVISDKDFRFADISRNGSTSAFGTPFWRDVTQAAADASDISAAQVAFANAFMAESPGVKHVCINHIASGTTPFQMLDPADDQRKWEDEELVHNLGTNNGATGVSWVNVYRWFAFDPTTNHVAATLPIFTGKLIDGTPVAKGTALSLGRNYTLTHDFRDLYDFTKTKLNIVTGGYGSWEAWKAVHEDANFPEMTASPYPLIGAQHGYEQTPGDWTDWEHLDTRGGTAGAVREAKMLASELMRLAGITPDYQQASLPNSDYSSGTHIDLWHPNYDITTWREAEGGMSSFVSGFTLNGSLITTEAQLQANAGGSGRIGVRITPTSGTVSSGDVVGFGDVLGQNNFKGIPYGQDVQPPAAQLIAGWHNDLPIIDVGQPAGFGMTILPREQYPNNLPQPSFFTSTETPLLAPDGVNDQLGMTFFGRVRLNGSGGTMFGQAARGVWEVFPSGGMNLNRSDGTNFIIGWDGDGVTNLAIDGQWIDLVYSESLTDDIARIWRTYNGTTIYLETNFTRDVTAYTSGANRKFAILGIADLDVQECRVWREPIPGSGNEDVNAALTALGTPDTTLLPNGSGGITQTGAWTPWA